MEVLQVVSKEYRVVQPDFDLVQLSGLLAARPCCQRMLQGRKLAQLIRRDSVEMWIFHNDNKNQGIVTQCDFCPLLESSHF